MADKTSVYDRGAITVDSLRTIDGVVAGLEQLKKEWGVTLSGSLLLLDKDESAVTYVVYADNTPYLVPYDLKLDDLPI